MMHSAVQHYGGRKLMLSREVAHRAAVFFRLLSGRSVNTRTGTIMKPIPMVIAGPSGCGKSTLLKKLLVEFPDSFGFSISHTTRTPRPGEVDGREYHFTSREKMQKSIDDGEFIESAVYNQNLYGTSKAAVEDVTSAGKVCLLDIDMQEKRLRGRGTETEESLARRLEIAKKELEYGEEPGNFNYVIVNDDLDRTYEEFKEALGKEIGKDLSS